MDEVFKEDLRSEIQQLTAVLSDQRIDPNKRSPNAVRQGFGSMLACGNHRWKPKCFTALWTHCVSRHSGHMVAPQRLGHQLGDALVHSHIQRKTVRLRALELASPNVPPPGSQSFQPL